MVADLHLHTYYSDGSWSPQELIDRAISLGFNCIALTDHDTVAALSEASDYAAGKIRLINGIELNTIWVNPDGEAQDVHILGYFINLHAASLQEAIARQQAARQHYLQEILNRLASRYNKVCLNEIKAASGRGSIGKPHICAAMVAAGITGDVAQAHKMLTAKDSALYFRRPSISPSEAIAAIAGAGGISSLAHPGKEPNLPLLIEHLCASGLEAVEAYHRSHTSTQVRRYLRLARLKHLLVTGGSDCHGPWDSYPASIGTVRLAPDIVQRLEQAHRAKHVSHQPRVNQ